MSKHLIPFCLLIGTLLIQPVKAQQAAPDASTDFTPPDRELTIGTKVAAPFVMKDENGNWSGISIRLWRQIATGLGLRYHFVERDMEGMLAGVEAGELDAAIAAISITPERERGLDFSQPYLRTGLGIVVPVEQGQASWFGVVQHFFSLGFLKVVAALVVLLLIVGAVVWLFERRNNSEEFPDSMRHGLASGLWWAAVTMTTVGYGDKAPRTLGGRIIGLIWMFAAIIIISSFTAAITSSLTVNSLKGGIQSEDDLRPVRVAAMANSTSAAFLDAQKIKYVSSDNLEDMLQGVAQGEYAAAVHDAPILNYLIENEYSENLTMINRVFARQSYGIALPTKSPLLEPINQSLLSITETQRWQALMDQYTGW